MSWCGVRPVGKKGTSVALEVVDTVKDSLSQYSIAMKSFVTRIEI